MSHSSYRPSSGLPADAAESAGDVSFALVRETLEKLRFGAVHLTVHEGRLVQIDVTEKIRLTA